MTYKNYHQELVDKWRGVDPLPVHEAFEVLRVSLDREQERVKNLRMAHEDLNNANKPPSETYRQLWAKCVAVDFARERLEQIIPEFYCLGLFEYQREQKAKGQINLF